MDLLPSIDELRDELMAHDLAVREIIALDQYIEKQIEQTFLSNMGDCDMPPANKLIRIGVAEGLKRMFKEYRLQKWLKVQEMANTVRTVLNSVPLTDEDTSLIQPAIDSSPWPQQEMIPGNVPVPTSRPVLRPGNNVWQPTPVQSPLLMLLSPINTPQVTTTLQPPQTIHSSSPHIINRQLFPDGHCPDMVNPTSASQQMVPYHTSRITQNHQQLDYTGTQYSSPVIFYNTENQNEELRHVNTNPSISSANNTLVLPQESENHPAILHQSEFPTVIPSNQDNHLGQLDQNEHLNDMGDEMDWDSDYDSSFDESEENLAGVLFATERLLPEEQAVRLDVEMGDMGVGHILFDRVSAAWNKYQCTFYRAG